MGPSGCGNERLMSTMPGLGLLALTGPPRNAGPLGAGAEVGGRVGDGVARTGPVEDQEEWIGPTVQPLAAKALVRSRKHSRPRKAKGTLTDRSSKAIPQNLAGSFASYIERTAPAAAQT